MTLRKTLLALAVIAAPVGACAEPWKVVEQRTDMRDAPRGSRLLRQAMVEGHAATRAAVGEPPLAWSDKLAADAAAYAAELARTGRFTHSPQPRGVPNQGENLWMGTIRAFRFDEMVGHWAGEKRFFKAGATPNVSTTGRVGDVGHYTQMIWRQTKQVGCGMASNATDDYLVCRYLPAGNVVGQEPLAP